MRGLVVVLAFVLAFGAVLYVLLDRQELLGSDGVTLLWNPPQPKARPKRERVDATPLAAMLRTELTGVEEAKANLARERKQFAAERETLEAQRDAMAAELEAVRLYREELERQQAANVLTLGRMLSSMDAAAAAEILEKLPESLAVQVLLVTKQRESGAMLEELEPDKAAVLSERVARVNLPAS